MKNVPTTCSCSNLVPRVSHLTAPWRGIRRTANAAAGLGSTSPSLRTGRFTSLGTNLSATNAQEMVLILKPSKHQSGGQVTPDTMDQFWQRRLCFDLLTTAPHVDRMMKLLNDMKGLEVQALPSTLPGQGPNSSDYFRLQGLWLFLPAQPVKRPLMPKPSASIASPVSPAIQNQSGRPPTPTSFEDALQQRAEIEKRLDEFKKKSPSKTWRKCSNGVTKRPLKKQIIIGGS